MRGTPVACQPAARSCLAVAIAFEGSPRSRASADTLRGSVPSRERIRAIVMPRGGGREKHERFHESVGPCESAAGPNGRVGRWPLGVSVNLAHRRWRRSGGDGGDVPAEETFRGAFRRKRRSIIVGTRARFRVYPGPRERLRRLAKPRAGFRPSSAGTLCTSARGTNPTRDGLSHGERSFCVRAVAPHPKLLDDRAGEGRGPSCASEASPGGTEWMT